MLAGRMMNHPLTLTHLLEHARTFHGKTEIVTQAPDKSRRRMTYADLHERASKLARALQRLGVGPGDRVATLCWNHGPHLEAYFGVPAMGAIIHTLNLRLHPTELAYIVQHAEDKVLLVDRTLLPLFEKFRAQTSTIQHVIVVPDSGPAGDAGLDYEQLIAAEPEGLAFPMLDEATASMLCYTSGTTGRPKGVLYSHRSTVLHTLVSCMADTIGVRESDVVLPVVPMFHAAAWGLPYSAVTAGSRIVMPGPHLDPASLLDLMATERVTLAAGVPTIWIGILALLDQDPKRWDLSAMRAMVIGGSAAPASVIEGFEKRHGLHVTHAWGMTETNPLGTLARIKSTMPRDGATVLAARASQGFPVPFIEERHVDDDGRVLPWDGKTMGELEVRGPWVAASYYRDEDGERFTEDGWFKTGDIVTIDPEGYMRITDRAKDVIKSGGEWISSVALENALMSHPAVLEAAVFAAKHPKWDERPLAAIVKRPGLDATRDELLAHLEGAFPKFWLPDDVIFVDQIPRTSTGKFLKSKLRELYEDHLLGAAQG